jgi:tetratricopeptide (TPR) repeat protein
MGNRRLWIISGFAVLAFGLALISFRPEGVSTGSHGEARTSAPLPSKSKWETSQKATFAALTQATPYQVEQKVEDPCTAEYEALGQLSTESIMTRIKNQDAGLSEACIANFTAASPSMSHLLDDIHKNCKNTTLESKCLTPLISLKSMLIEASTRGSDPADLPNHILLSKIYARSGEYDQTPAEFQATLAMIEELESRDPELGFDNLKLYLLSNLAAKDKTHVAAFEGLTEVIKAEKPEDALAYLFKFNYFNGDYEKTEHLVKEHLTQHPDSALALYFMAIVEYEKGNKGAALKYAERSAEMDPKNSFMRQQLQKLRDNPKNWDRAFSLPSTTYNFGP